MPSSDARLLLRLRWTWAECLLSERVPAAMCLSEHLSTQDADEDTGEPIPTLCEACECQGMSAGLVHFSAIIV